jgi:hypothetical protein
MQQFLLQLAAWHSVALRCVALRINIFFFLPFIKKSGRVSVCLIIIVMSCKSP